MSSALLQIIALITMAVDHVGYALFPTVPLMRSIGRFSFPIFAFLLVEGFVHTSDRKKYAIRLAAFAVISEIPFELFVYGRVSTHAFYPENIFFTLLFGFLAMLMAEKGKFWFIGSASMVLLADFVGCDYGAYGVLLVLCFYLFRDKRLLAMLIFALLTVFYCLTDYSWFQLPALLAAAPLLLYNGQRGHRLPKYLAYIFYPAHLLIIFLVGKYIY